MKKEKRCCSPGWDLKVLAWIGATAYVILICALFVVGFLGVQKSAMSPGASTLDNERRAAFNEPLGELQSRCGGPDRLPCGPGLACSANSPDQMGKCLKVETAINQTAAYANLNDVCGGQAPLCAPGSYCKKNDTAGKSWGTCNRFDADAPFISSVKIENMQLDMSGVYRGASGTQAKITIQAVNASSAIMELSEKEKPQTGGSSSIGETKAGSGGLFFSTLSINQGLMANLVIKAQDKNGDISLVSIPVASAE